MVKEEDCPCFHGGSCPTDYRHADDVSEDLRQEIARVMNIK